MFSTVSETITALKSGELVIVCDHESRENEGDFVILADYCTPEIVNFLIRKAGGLICVALTKTLAEKLDFPLMVVNPSDPLRTAFTVSVDHKATTTGISALERSLTIRMIAQENSQAKDFKKPGHIFPIIAHSEGLKARAGHTEAAVELALLCQAKPVAVICEILNQDGHMARRSDLSKIASEQNIKIISIQCLKDYIFNNL